ncbi:MAG: hypothetical protein CMG57_06910 [Candidatus Marinimicrobia bacterium]|nr:hypothetical protein [Candidatus Neomarinimicrobiota bacterium]
MIHRITVFIFFSMIFSQTSHPSIHQEQMAKEKLKPKIPIQKIKIRTGLDVLLDSRQDLIQGKSIALVTNQSGIDKNGIPNYRRLMNIQDLELKIIFSPEHGLFGEAGAGEKVNYSKQNSNLPRVISLYGKTRKPTVEMLQGIDIILYDIQDIGARFYTYISTLGLVMEAAGQLKIPIIVLDRPNPIRGDIIQGPILDLDYKTFVGYYPIPIRYGGTVGKLARKIIENKWISPLPRLEVIENEGWKLNLWYDETDLPWVKPSPNIPDLETAILYPGMCIIEGTNISEGRGTQNPFKQIGAPWLNGKLLSQKLNNFKLPGVVFAPVSFTPVSIPGISIHPKFQDEQCYGVEIFITDRNSFSSVKTGVITLFTLYSMNPEKVKFQEFHLNRLWGSDKLYKALLNEIPLIEFLETF